MFSISKGRIAVLAGVAAILHLSHASSMAAEPAGKPAADELLLRDGDSITGKLLQIDSSRSVRWQHPDVAEPIDFDLNRVSQIRFHPAAPPTSVEESPCKVLLAGGDELRGSFVAYDRTNLFLQTWYAGQLKIPRKWIRSIYFPPVTPDIFALSGATGWTQGSAATAAFSTDPGEWEFRYGAFYAAKSASIARDVKLPPSADIQFDIAWSGSLSLSMALYTDSLQPLLLSDKDTAPAFGGFYSLQFLPGLFVNLARVKKSEPVLGLDSPVAVPALAQTNRVHLEIRASKPSNLVALSVDGLLVEVWHDTNGFVGEGTGVRFVHNPGGLIKVSDLRVAVWDGILEQDQPGSNSVTQDIVSLTNAATLAGEITEAAQGKITLRGARDTTTLPVVGVRRLTFSNANDASVEPLKGAVRAQFAVGGFLTFELLEWNEKGVDIRSPVFGNARINPAAFGRIELSPPASETSAGPN